MNNANCKWSVCMYPFQSNANKTFSFDDVDRTDDKENNNANRTDGFHHFVSVVAIAIVNDSSDAQNRKNPKPKTQYQKQKLYPKTQNFNKLLNLLHLFIKKFVSHYYFTNSQ